MNTRTLNPIARSLAQGIMGSKDLFLRFVAGFDDSNKVTQATNLLNHFAWNMGHISLVMHRVAGKLDGRELPESDFIEKATRGDATRFGTKTCAFGSIVSTDSNAFPSHARCIAIFECSCARLARVLEEIPDAKLNDETQWGSGMTTFLSLAQRMVFHNGVHAGELIDLRRALGMPRVMG